MATGFPFQREYVVVVVTTLLWGTLHPLGKIVLQDVDPAHLALCRSALSFLALTALCLLVDGTSSLRRVMRQWRLAAVLGVLGFCLASYLTMASLALLPAGVNSVLSNTSPIFVALVAMLSLRQRAVGRLLPGVLLAFVGVVVLALHNQPLEGLAVNLLGVLLALTGSLSWALYTLGGRRLLKEGDPIAATAVAAMFGGVPLAILTAVGAGFEPLLSAPPTTQLLLVFIGVVATAMTYSGWYYGVRHLGAARLAVFQYLIPLAGLLNAFVLLGEPLTPPVLGGAALILAGVWWAQRAGPTTA